VASATIAGAVSSGATGYALAVLGDIVVPTAGRAVALSLAAVSATVLAFNEFGALAFDTIGVRRQTSKLWIHKYGFTLAAALWGLHIGLGFTTRVTYGGYWALLAIVFAIGDARVGIAVMTAYWLGRALPLWLMPLLVPSATVSVNLGAVSDIRRRMVGVGLVVCAVAAVVLAAGAWR